MNELELSLACGDYDRTRPLIDGRVRAEGCKLRPLVLTPEEIFFRAFHHAAFDVAELSFSSYLVTTAAGTCPYVALPAFVSRSFRHSSIYVARGRGIVTSQDLRGRRVGAPEYQLTAIVWARILLEEEYGVRPSDMRWMTGGVEQPGRPETVRLDVPAAIAIDAAPPGRTLQEMLLAGEIDAIICPRAPSLYTAGDRRIGRLFEDDGAETRAYYERRGVFPIMHVIGVRKELAAANPWLPAALLKAFEAARRIALAALADVTALSVSLPWLLDEVERTRRLMGDDFWPYGIAANRTTLDCFLRHHHRQGLSSRTLALDEVFHPSTLDRFSL
jgi:4,5-dihydroxyphthalate decarboxylase